MIVWIGAGTYRVEHDGRSDLVYVAGQPEDRWVFWDGYVWRSTELDTVRATDQDADYAGRYSVEAGPPWVEPPPIRAPMPARVIRILAQSGASVKKGNTLILIEAMKMGLQIRSPGDAIVTTVHCREGELVQTDAVLMEVRRL